MTGRGFGIKDEQMQSDVKELLIVRSGRMMQLPEHEAREGNPDRQWQQ
jgi:hypothetical protein